MKSVIIVGSGPAGISAALYLQRSGKIDVTVISKGTSALCRAEKIENYYGFAQAISGEELYKNGIEGAKRLGVKFIDEEVVSLGFDESFKPVVGTDKSEYPADAVLLATGAARKSSDIKGLKEHEGKGVSYCAVCDAFFYKGKAVCVIGDGEYALHEAQTLANTSESVTILSDGKSLSVGLTGNIKHIDTKIVSIDGEDTVRSVTFENGDTINVSGVFVALGVAGSTDLARKVGAEVENGHIKVNENMETNIPGLYAAGDCTGGTMQVYKAVSDGASTAFSIIKYLK